MAGLLYLFDFLSSLDSCSFRASGSGTFAVSGCSGSLSCSTVGSGGSGWTGSEPSPIAVTCGVTTGAGTTTSGVVDGGTTGSEKMAPESSD